MTEHSSGKFRRLLDIEVASTSTVVQIVTEKVRKVNTTSNVAFVATMYPIRSIGATTIVVTPLPVACIRAPCYGEITTQTARGYTSSKAGVHSPSNWIPRWVCH